MIAVALPTTESPKVPFLKRWLAAHRGSFALSILLYLFFFLSVESLYLVSSSFFGNLYNGSTDYLNEGYYVLNPLLDAEKAASIEELGDYVYFYDTASSFEGETLSIEALFQEGKPAFAEKSGFQIGLNYFFTLSYEPFESLEPYALATEGFGAYATRDEVSYPVRGRLELGFPKQTANRLHAAGIENVEMALLVDPSHDLLGEDNGLASSSSLCYVPPLIGGQPHLLVSGGSWRFFGSRANVSAAASYAEMTNLIFALFLVPFLIVAVAMMAVLSYIEGGFLNELAALVPFGLSSKRCLLYLFLERWMALSLAFLPTLAFVVPLALISEAGAVFSLGGGLAIAYAYPLLITFFGAFASSRKTLKAVYPREGKA